MRNKWTEKEILVLRSMYADHGTDIPELLQRHTRSSIRSLACRLHLGQRVFIWNDTPYSSIRALCSANGFDRARVQSALNKGLSVEDAIKYSLDGPQRCIVEGVPYRTYEEASAAYGMKYTTVYKRLRAGEALQDILLAGNQRQQGGPQSVVYNGKVYPSLISACKAAGGENSNGVMAARQRNPELSHQEAFDVWLSERYNTAAGVSKRNHFSACAYAYTSDVGTLYFYIYCDECKRVLLLTGEQACTQVHGSICDLQELPAGFSVPYAFKRSVTIKFGMRVSYPELH